MHLLTYPFSLGEYQGFILKDYSQAHSAEELIVNPAADELDQIAREYAFELHSITVDYNNLLLRTWEQTVLVDAGIPRPYGNLSLGLEQLNIEPGEIDTIVITHSDRDHIGGILGEAGSLTFPKARYVMLEDTWQNFSSEEKRAELTRLNKWTNEKTLSAWETYSKIEDRIFCVKPGEEFFPGFRLYPAPGHRHDHSVFQVNSSGECLEHLSDALVHPLFMAKRAWYSTYDANPAQAVATKERLLHLCSSDNALVFGSHFPFPGLGYVQQGHDSWRWQPLARN